MIISGLTERRRLIMVRGASNDSSSHRVVRRVRSRGPAWFPNPCDAASTSIGYRHGDVRGITDLKENDTYEVGYADERGLQPHCWSQPPARRPAERPQRSEDTRSGGQVPLPSSHVDRQSGDGGPSFQHDAERGHAERRSSAAALIPCRPAVGGRGTKLSARRGPTPQLGTSRVYVSYPYDHEKFLRRLAADLGGPAA